MSKRPKAQPGWQPTILDVTDIPWDENHEPTKPEITEHTAHFPFVAQVFPRYRFEAWDELHLCPIRTPGWVTRIFRIEEDPQNIHDEKRDSDTHRPIRVLLALNDTFRTERGAQRGALKLLADVRMVWPLVARRREKGKAFRFAPILGKDRDDPKGPEIPVSDLAKIVTV